MKVSYIKILISKRDNVFYIIDIINVHLLKNDPHHRNVGVELHYVSWHNAQNEVKSFVAVNAKLTKLCLKLI